jgi:hypothetical protein
VLEEPNVNVVEPDVLYDLEQGAIGVRPAR